MCENGTQDRRSEQRREELNVTRYACGCTKVEVYMNGAGLVVESQHRWNMRGGRKRVWWMQNPDRSPGVCFREHDLRLPNKVLDFVLPLLAKLRAQVARANTHCTDCMCWRDRASGCRMCRSELPSEMYDAKGDDYLYAVYADDVGEEDSIVCVKCWALADARKMADRAYARSDCRRVTIVDRNGAIVERDDKSKESA